MAGENPLPELRKIRDQIRRIDAERDELTNNRDQLIRRAVQLHLSERQIAEAAGVSPGRVNQIVHRR